MTLSFGATLALAVWRDSSGLPALPLLSLGFLLANADLIWRSYAATGHARHKPVRGSDPGPRVTARRESPDMSVDTSLAMSRAWHISRGFAGHKANRTGPRV